MLRSLALPTLALAGLLGHAAAVQAAIPLTNALCPGDLEVHADEGGPIYVNGRETKLKQFNENYYEAFDSQSGVTLSLSRKPDGGVDLSYTGRGGANGVCVVARQIVAGTGPAPAASGPATSSGLPVEVTCESRGSEQQECDMDTRGNVELVRQLSHSACVEGQSWGLNRHSIWVKDGCRAVFRNNSSEGHAPHHASANGGVQLGACNMRANADGALVTRVPVNDTLDELIVDYPDGRFLCMVTKEGMVQSLTRIKQRSH